MRESGGIAQGVREEEQYVHRCNNSEVHPGLSTVRYTHPGIALMEDHHPGIALMEDHHPGYQQEEVRLPGLSTGRGTPTRV